MSSTHRGLFIVFEGGEGSGKSTQAAKLSEALELHGVANHLTREPGATPLGKKLRTLLLDRDGDPISQKAEALLFAADRAEHVEKVIKPNLNTGRTIICDRYIASTMAYQSYAGGLDADMVRAMSAWASSGLYPDLTFFLDVDPVVGLERAGRGERTRFEDKNVAYHDKVRRGFLDQRNDSWVTIDAVEPLEQVHEKILDHTLHILNVIERSRNNPRVNTEGAAQPEKLLSPVEDNIVHTNFPGKADMRPIKLTNRFCPECGIILSKTPGYMPQCAMCAEDLSDLAQYGAQPEPVIRKSTAALTAPRCPECDVLMTMYNRQPEIGTVYECLQGHGHMLVDGRGTPEDLSNLAQQFREKSTTCGVVGCIEHPVAPKVEGINHAY